MPSARAAAATPGQPVVEPLPFPLDATIPELQEAMEGGRITSVELVEFYLARIAAYDTAGPKLKALLLVNPAARDEAAAMDAERAASGPRGPLHGIPIVLKDNIGTADLPTTAGSLALDGFRPSEDAFQVRMLREAGAVIIGKANMCEFALCWVTASSLGGQTRSPYDLSRDPGGSSGGTAVAVAANFAAVGLGSDTCGSVRLPAGLNNLYGLRPTSGLSSRAGVIPFSFTMDTIGPMGRSVADIAIVLDATVGVDPADPTTIPVDTSYLGAIDPDGLAGRRIGLVAFGGDPEVGRIVGAAIDEMAADGVEVIEVAIPGGVHIEPLFDEFQSALDSYLAAQPGAPVASLNEIVAMSLNRPAMVDAYIRERAAVTSLDTSGYHSSLAGREPFRDAVVALMDKYDLDAIAYPVSAVPAAVIGASQPPFDCSSAAYGGLPAMAVPAGATADGLPLGVELMGRPFDEPLLIAIAAGYEAHTSHRILPPMTPPLER